MSSVFPEPLSLSSDQGFREFFHKVSRECGKGVEALVPLVRVFVDVKTARELQLKCLNAIAWLPVMPCGISALVRRVVRHGDLRFRRMQIEGAKEIGLYGASAVRAWDKIRPFRQVWVAWPRLRRHRMRTKKERGSVSLSQAMELRTKGRMVGAIIGLDAVVELSAGEWCPETWDFIGGSGPNHAARKSSPLSMDSLDRSVVDIMLSAIEIDHVPRHLGDEKSHPKRIDFSEKFIDSVVGITHNIGVRRRKKGARLLRKCKRCVGDFHQNRNARRRNEMKHGLNLTILAARMRLFVNALHVIAGHMCIDLSGREICVPQHCLHRSQVGPFCKKMGRERMPEFMR